MHSYSPRHVVVRVETYRQHAEQREQQLTENISQTARPLVRQIDMLRATLADQTSAHEVCMLNASCDRESRWCLLRSVCMATKKYVGW